MCISIASDLFKNSVQSGILPHMTTTMIMSNNALGEFSTLGNSGFSLQGPVHRLQASKMAWRMSTEKLGDAVACTE